MHISYTAAWLKPINKRDDDYISQRWSSNKNSLNSLKKLLKWPVRSCWLTSRDYYYGRDRSYFSKQCSKRCQTFRTRRGYVQACFWMHVTFTKDCWVVMRDPHLRCPAKTFRSAESDKLNFRIHSNSTEQSCIGSHSSYKMPRGEK